MLGEGWGHTHKPETGLSAMLSAKDPAAEGMAMRRSFAGMVNWPMPARVLVLAPVCPVLRPMLVCSCCRPTLLCRPVAVVPPALACGSLPFGGEAATVLTRPNRLLLILDELAAYPGEKVYGYCNMVHTLHR